MWIDVIGNIKDLSQDFVGRFRPVSFWLFNTLWNHNESLWFLTDLCKLSWLDVHNFDKLQYDKFVYLSKYDSAAINKVINNFNKITELLKSDILDLNVLEFFIYLSSFNVLDDFLDVFDAFDLSDCNYNCAVNIVNKLNFSKIKLFKSFLKDNDIDTFFDIWAAEVLYNVNHIYTTSDSSLFLWVVYPEGVVHNNDYWCHSCSFPGESLPYKDFIVFDPSNFDFVTISKKYWKTYSFWADMWKSSPILSWNALKLLFSYLPAWSKVVNCWRRISNWSLSWDSFPLVLNLFQKQKLFNVDVSLKPWCNWLNFQWKKSKLSKLIIEKMWGTEAIDRINSDDPNNDNIFETKNYSDALEIVDLINDLILKYTGDKKFYAYVEKFGGDDWIWRIKIPSFVITKKR